MCKLTRFVVYNMIYSIKYKNMYLQRIQMCKKYTHKIILHILHI